MERKIRQGNMERSVFYDNEGWYAVKGATVVCRTFQDMAECRDLNRITNVDAFQWEGRIETEEEFMKALGSWTL